MRGALDAREELSRLAAYAGDYKRAEKVRRENGGNVIITATEEKEITSAASVEATAWANEIEAMCRQVLLNVHAGGTYDSAMIGDQLAAVVRAYTEDKPSDTVDFAARRKRGRRMKVRDAEAYERWQRERMPYQKYLDKVMVPDVIKRARRKARNKKSTPAERSAAKALLGQLKTAKIPRTLKQKHATIRMQTGHTRWYNRKQVKKALDTDEVLYLQWTTKRDSRVCNICAPYDLWTVKKADAAVASKSPPLHHRCRCKWMFVDKAAAEKDGITPTEKPDVQPAPGFGGEPEAPGPKWKPTMTREEANAWASDSVIGQDVFHGTSEGFAKKIKEGGFADSRIGTSSGNSGLFGQGHYFTSNKLYAEGYAGGAGRVERRKTGAGAYEGKTLKARARLQKPLDFDSDDYTRIFDQANKDVLASSKKRSDIASAKIAKAGAFIGPAVSRRITELAVKAGHDGIIVRSVANLTGEPADEVVVFSSKNIVVVEE